MILVPGATGNSGTEIVQRLTTRNVHVRALLHVEVVEGDFRGTVSQTIQAAGPPMPRPQAVC